MAKKIDGFTVKDSGEMPNILPFPPNDSPQCVTVVLHDHRHERVFTESEVNELIKAGNAMSVAMYQYQMDVDDDPPQKHRDMMNAWESAVRRLSDPA